MVYVNKARSSRYKLNFERITVFIERGTAPAGGAWGAMNRKEQAFDFLTPFPCTKKLIFWLGVNVEISSIDWVIRSG